MGNAHHQRGVAAVAVILLLLFALTLIVGFAHRNLMFEQRAAANQIRSLRAFEAADAGLEWAQAMLNHSAAIGADCEPATAPGSSPFRERFLAYDAASQRFTPLSWNDGGTPTALQPGCVFGDGAWSCSCPSDGLPALPAPTDSAAHPAFTVRFVAHARAGTVQLVATGCDHLGPSCAPGAAGAASGRASATAQVTLTLLPALATQPIAALTAGGSILADGALKLVNTDPAAGGLTAQAAGAIALPHAQLVTLAGRSGAASLAASDAQLAAADPQRLAARFLGLDRSRWLTLAGARSLSCEADCTAALADALGANTEHPLLWLAGDLRLAGPITVGTPERPVVLVVPGQLQLGSAVVIHGLVVSLAPSWNSTGTANAQLHGGLIALGDVVGSGTPTISHDAAVLARLRGERGSFVRVPGSWRNF